MSNLSNEISVRLNISGFDCDPEEVTALLSKKPSFSWRAGDFIKGTQRRYPENGWRIESSLPRTAPMEDQLCALVDVLEEHALIIQDLARRFDAEISCVVYANEYMPPLFFGNKLLARVAALGLSIDLDIYCLMEETS